MHRLTRLERRILALLEEAGEENISALTNSISRPLGSSNEIFAMSSALATLTDLGYIRISVHRDDSSRRWVPLPVDQERKLVQELASNIQWSFVQNIWRWVSELPSAMAVLTDTGRVAANKILTEDGWPDAPLDRYE
jgi:hypothetical protein